MTKMIIASLIGVVIMIAAFMILDPNVNLVKVSDTSNTTSVDVSSDDSSTGTKVSIKIEGAVVNPGTYTMVDTATWQDVIDKAGGTLSSTDLDGYTSTKCIKGYDVIYIPYMAGYSEECVSVVTEKVNVNTASEDELASVNGITTLLAGKIVTYRDENGPFDSIEDLTKVSGIGTKTYEKIRDKVTIS